MKKLFTLVALVSMSFYANAQLNEAGKAYVKESKTISNERFTSKTITPNDTAGWTENLNFLPVFSPTGGVTLFRYSGGGWIYGVNISDNNLNECAQGYENINESTVGIGEILMFFASKTNVSNDPTSKAVVKVYNMAANRAINTDGSGGQALNSPGPFGNPIASADLLFSDIDTSESSGGQVTLFFNIVPLAQTAVVNGNFAVGVDFSDMKAKGDTAGLLCDNVGDANNQDYAFHRVGNTWFVTDFIYSPSGTGTLDNSIAIFAVVETDFVNVGGPDFFSGMKLSQNTPNPAIDLTRIEYELEKPASNVVLDIIDVQGRNVYSKTLTNQGAGLNFVEVGTSNLNAGVYYYTLTTDGRRLTKKMVISK